MLFRSKYWIDGNEIILGSFVYKSAANAIILKGSDIYVAGYQYLSNLGYSVATLWKNGVASSLSTQPSWAYSVDVLNGNTYVSGEVKDLSNYNTMAAFWKNSQEFLLTSSAQDAAGNSIKVFGNDVYIAGYIDDNACYWKNGALTVLSKSNGSAIEWANSIVLK